MVSENEEGERVAKRLDLHSKERNNCGGEVEAGHAPRGAQHGMTAARPRYTGQARTVRATCIASNSSSSSRTRMQPATSIFRRI